MNDRLDERLAFASAKLSLARFRLTRREGDYVEAVAAVENLQRAIAQLLLARDRRDRPQFHRKALRRLARGTVPVAATRADPLADEIRKAEHALKTASTAVVAARTEDELTPRMEAMARAKSHYGALLLARDRRDRPHIYAGRATAR